MQARLYPSCCACVFCWFFVEGREGGREKVGLFFFLSLFCSLEFSEQEKEQEENSPYLRVLLFREVADDVVPLRVLLAEHVEQERVDVVVERIVVLFF